MKSSVFLFAIFVTVVSALAVDAKDTMCVRLKDGTYKCKASGKIEKKPCCDTPSNDPTPNSKRKK
jgi:hypothetical protein